MVLSVDPEIRVSSHPMSLSVFSTCSMQRIVPVWPTSVWIILPLGSGYQIFMVASIPPVTMYS